MNSKFPLIGIYFAIVILWTLYGTFFGEYSDMGFWYNLGRGLFWPLNLLIKML